jgi:DNA-binding FadR family transcriptional regulator
LSASQIQLQPLAAPGNLTSELVRRLSDEIRGGALKAGDRLPTEQELMRQTGVSRTVVREAIAALKAEGLVQTRQGVGAFVGQPDMQATFRISAEEAESIPQVLMILELRIAVEAEAAAIAAERRTPLALGLIADAHAGFVAAVAEGEVAVEADFAFHRAVLEATGNPYFPRLLQFLGQLIIPRQAVRGALADADSRAAYLARITAEHAAVLDAIAARDAKGAEAAMRAHLTAGRERYRAMAATAPN